MFQQGSICSIISPGEEQLWSTVFRTCRLKTSNKYSKCLISALKAYVTNIFQVWRQTQATDKTIPVVYNILVNPEVLFDDVNVIWVFDVFLNNVFSGGSSWEVPCLHILITIISRSLCSSKHSTFSQYLSTSVSIKNSYRGKSYIWSWAGKRMCLMCVMGNCRKKQRKIKQLSWEHKQIVEYS